MSDKPRCCENVWKRFHSWQCPRKGVVTRNGKNYCKQHDPEEIKVRNERRHAWHLLKIQEVDERIARRSAALALVDGIPTHEIKKYKAVLK